VLGTRVPELPMLRVRMSWLLIRDIVKLADAELLHVKLLCKI
jgi:hypothetical protein